MIPDAKEILAESKNRAKNYLDDLQDILSEQIKSAAEFGYDRVIVNVDDLGEDYKDFNSYDMIRAVLESKGYKIEILNDSECNQYLFISWRKDEK